jgi:hypothetical protein
MDAIFAPSALCLLGSLLSSNSGSALARPRKYCAAMLMRAPRLGLLRLRASHTLSSIGLLEIKFTPPF